MKRLIRPLIILATTLLVLAIAGWAALSIWVGTEKGRTRIAGELGKALGLPLEVRKVSLGFGALRLLDVRVSQGETTFLEAPVFSTEYQFLPLLHREVVLRKMILENPHVRWPQNAEGKWVLPIRKGEERSTPKEPREKRPGEKKFQVALDTFEVRNGEIELLNQDGTHFAHGSDMYLKALLARAGEASAEVTVASVALLENGPIFEQVHLPFTYGEGKLIFPKVEATLGGGTVHGKLELDTKEKSAPFELQLGLDKVNLARAVPSPDWQIRSGVLDASLSLQGTQHDFERGIGQGELRITQATVDTLEPLLRLVGVVCRVPELAGLRLSMQSNVRTVLDVLGLPEQLTLREASTAFHLEKKQTVVDRLLIDAGDLVLGVKGNVSRDGKLDLDATLSVSDALARKLPSSVRESLQPLEGTANRGIAFDITGKNDRPKTNLFDKVLGGQIDKQIGSLVDSIFGGRSKEKDRDKDREKKEEKERKEKEKQAQKEREEEAKRAEKEERKKQKEAERAERVMKQRAAAAATPVPPGAAAPPPAEIQNPAPEPTEEAPAPAR